MGFWQFHRHKTGIVIPLTVNLRKAVGQKRWIKRLIVWLFFYFSLLEWTGMLLFLKTRRVFISVWAQARSLPLSSTGGGTCYTVWRRSPWRRRVRWCGWRRWRPAGCWSRNANLRGWSSWVVSLRKMSTVSPTHAEIRRGRSYTHVPHVGKPPAHQNKALLYVCNVIRINCVDVSAVC